MTTIERIQEIFREVFDEDDLVIERSTTARQVPAWDSLMHVTLMISVEKSFGIRFRSGDVAGLKDVGALVDLVERMTRG